MVPVSWIKIVNRVLARNHSPYKRRSRNSVSTAAAIIESLEPRSLLSSAPLNLNTPVSGNLTTAGQQDTYTFTLSSFTDLYFDSRTNDSQINWQLTGPTGNQFGATGRSLSSGDDILRLMPAGPYTLTVFGSGSHTGSYGFNLSSLTSATPMFPNAPVNGTLTPANGAQLYQFSGTAGQTFYFTGSLGNFSSTDTSGQNGSATWTLMDQYGNVLFNSNLLFDGGRITLPGTGIYTLAVSGNVADNGTSSYSVEMTPVNDQLVSWNLNSPVLGSLATKGEQDTYLFTLNTDAHLYFDSLTNSDSIDWTLTGPQGVVSPVDTQFGHPFDHDDTDLGVLPAGPYTLKVVGELNATGAYAFNLLDLASATQINVGTSGQPQGPTVVGSLSPPNSTNLYSFNANAGDQYQFHNISVTSVTQSDWELLDPYGNVVFAKSYLGADQSDVTLNVTGTYTLIVSGAVGETTPTGYAFQVNFLSNTPPVTTTGIPLNFGTTYTGDSNSIGASGEVDFQFNLPSFTSLYFDSQTDDSGITWSLTGPRGTVVPSSSGTSPTAFSAGDQYLGPQQGGPYILRIFGSPGAEYRFSLLNLAQGQPTSIGTGLLTTLNPSNSTQTYNFFGVAGQSVYFGVNNASFSTTDTSSFQGYGTWSLFDQYGNRVFSGVNLHFDAGRQTLPTTGVYTLVLSGYIADNGSTTYVVKASAEPDQTLPLNINFPVNAQLSAPGEQDSYTFSLMTPQRLYFDSQSSNPNLLWTLTGPTGVVSSQANRPFNSDDENLGLLPPGPYTLTVSGNGNFTGGYAFNLLSLSGGAAISPGVPVHAVLNPADSTQLFAFPGTAGQTFNFIGSEGNFSTTDTSSAHGHATWTLYDQFGNQLFSTNLTTDGGSITLPSTGIYVIKVSGDVIENGTSNYTFNVAPFGAPKTVTTLENMPYVFTTTDFGFSNPSVVPADATYSVNIPTLPLAGTLTDNGTLVVQGASISAADVAAAKFKFVPAANASGLVYAQFTFQVQNNGGPSHGGTNIDPTPITMTINVTHVNQAPVGASNTVTLLENKSYVFKVSDFGFSDPNDSPQNSLLGVIISKVPLAGSLMDNGATVTAGMNIPVADITGGKLLFTPATDKSGTPYAAFTFHVQDNGGTANGGQNIDQTPRTITFNVTHVNQAPVGTSNTITILENKPYVFKTSDFGFTDPNDTPANTLLGVIISKTPLVGSLTDNGTTVTAGMNIPATDIATGKLIFTPALNKSGTPYAGVTFHVQDNGGTANGGQNTDPTPKLITFNVTHVNQPPVGASATITMLENKSYVFKTSDFGFSDPNDSPQNSLLAVIITNLPLVGSLTDNGNPVSQGMSVPAADISGGKLVFTPVANKSATPYAGFAFHVQDNGGTANGGHDTDPTARSMTINVTHVNQPPVGTSTTVTMVENTSYVLKTSDFGFSDPNDTPPNTLMGVIITKLPYNGSLTDNGTAVTAGMDVSAMDIANGKLVFTPVANKTGAPYAAFTFHVQDSGGTANGGNDTDPTPKTITFNVTA